MPVSLGSLMVLQQQNHHVQSWCKRAQLFGILSANSHLGDGSYAAHNLSQGIQLPSLFCRYHFSFTTCVLSTHYIPGVVLGAGDWTVCKRTRLWRYWSSSTRVWGCQGGSPPPMHLPPVFAVPHSVSPVTQSLSHEPIFGSLPLVYLPPPVPTLFVSSPARGLCSSLCALSVHGDIFPHLPHVLSANMFFLWPSFIREQKPFSLFLRQTLFLSGRRGLLVFWCSPLTSLSCSDGLFIVPCSLCM